MVRIPGFHCHDLWFVPGWGTEVLQYGIMVLCVDRRYRRANSISFPSLGKGQLTVAPVLNTLHVPTLLFMLFMDPVI